jgi:hypothetical protein
VVAAVLDVDRPQQDTSSAAGRRGRTLRFGEQEGAAPEQRCDLERVGALSRHEEGLDAVGEIHQPHDRGHVGRDGAADGEPTDPGWTALSHRLSARTAARQCAWRRRRS